MLAESQRPSRTKGAHAQRSRSDAPGTSQPFSIPYYYDDAGGGVVQVRVTGDRGRFVVYYDLETPRYAPGDDVPGPLDLRIDGGTPDAGGAEGHLRIRFVASPLVRSSASRVDPLTGTIHGAIYRSADIEALRPIEGREALEAIRIDGADLTAKGASVEYATGGLAPGSVMVLAFFDLDGNAVAGDEEPDSGDPVTISLASWDVVAGATTAIEVPFDLVR
jgi:hypothetical protein